MTLIIIQIPFIIYYIIFKDKSIRNFISKQIVIFNYFKILNPLKKGHKRNINNNQNKSSIKVLLNDSEASRKLSMNNNKYNNNSVNKNENINIIPTSNNNSLN